MNWPKISVVTPSFNQADFIEETICSVLDQAYPNLEYIIIDGGSTDGTVRIIEKYQEDIDYWISEPDDGQTQAINKGFRLCTGDLVAWQNSDDCYVPGAFAKVAHACQHCPADVYFGHHYNIDGEGHVIRPQCYPPFSLRAHIYEGLMVANQAAFWRRALFDEVGYLDERLQYSMDYEFFLRLGLAGYDFHLVDDFLGCFRIHGQSKTTQLGAKWEGDRSLIDAKHHLERKASWLNKTVSKLYRTYHYVRQGRIEYACRGLHKRLFGAYR